MTAPTTTGAFEIRQGDTLPVLTATLYASDGVTVVDLTPVGTTVRFRMAPETGGALKVDAPAVIVNAAGGVVSYAWNTADTDTDGEFKGFFIVSPGGVGSETYPGVEIAVIVRPRIAATPASGALASLADVHRVLGDSNAPDTSLDGDYLLYLQTASEWLRRRTGRDWGTGTGPFTETFDNVRADDFIDLAQEGATVTAVVAYPVVTGLGIPLAPPEGYTLSPGVSYQMAGDRVQLLWNAIGTPFEGAVDYIPPMHYQRVIITYTAPGTVPAPIRDGCAYLAVALKTAGPRIAAGLLSEQNEDYRYQLATEVAMGDPLIRGLVRDYRKRRVLVV